MQKSPKMGGEEAYLATWDRFLLGFYRLKWLILLSFFALVYGLVIVIHAENIPFTDDLSVLASLYEFQHTTLWYLKFKTLFAFHNEHRIVVPRLITMLLYYIQGEHISISWWIVVGNILLFLPLYLLFKAVFIKYKTVYFLPVLLFLLQPMHYELMYWGMASLQNLGVLALSFFCFYCLVYIKNLFGAAIIAILAVFTSINGLFVFIVGTVLLLYRKEFYNLIFWVVTGSLITFLYWQGFSVAENSGQTFGKSLQFGAIFMTFIRLTGGLVYSQSLSVLALLWGLFLLTVLVWYIGYHFLPRSTNSDGKPQQFLLCCLLFVFLTIGAISLGRSGENVLLVSRYKLYPALVVILIYSLTIAWTEHHPYFFRAIAGAGLLFWMISYARYSSLFESHSKLLFSHFFNWKYSNLLDITPASSAVYYADRWRKLYQLGAYVPAKSTDDKCRKIMSSINEKSHTTLEFSVSNQLVNIKPITLPVNAYYAVCKSKKQVAIYPLTTVSFYRTLFSPFSTNYAASVNYSYWLRPTNRSSFIVPSP